MNNVLYDPQSQTIPTLEDWGTHLFWARGDAFDHFNGKMLEEARLLIQSDALVYAEDFLYMDNHVFGYYIRAYMSYLLSSASEWDCDAASSFLMVIGLKVEQDPDDIKPLWDEIHRVLEHIAINQEFYDADLDIYGGFSERVVEIFAKAALTLT